jgi:hypothetical protein
LTRVPYLECALGINRAEIKDLRRYGQRGLGYFQDDAYGLFSRAGSGDGNLFLVNFAGFKTIAADGHLDGLRVIDAFRHARGGRDRQPVGVGRQGEIEYTSRFARIVNFKRPRDFGRAEVVTRLGQTNGRHGIARRNGDGFLFPSLRSHGDDSRIAGFLEKIPV